MVNGGVKAEDKERKRRMGKSKRKGRMRTGKETTSISPTSYSSEEDNIREKIIRIRVKRKTEKEFVRRERGGNRRSRFENGKQEKRQPI